MPAIPFQENTLMVLTSKSIATMVAEGGCGYWKADANRVRRMLYLAAACHDSPGSEPGVEAGAVFMLATIKEVVPAKDDRWLIKLGKFARVNLPNRWPKGNQNPVTYLSARTLGIPDDSLRWAAFPDPQNLDESTTDDPKVSPLTFEEAKAGLAVALGVRPEQIQITVTA